VLYSCFVSEPDDGIAATQAATDSTTPAPGTRFAKRYLVDRLLGRGGMGSVWAVLDVDLGERVALKTLDKADASTTTVERFRREVRLARRVTHRNVARIFDIGESSGVHYLTMELVEGESLAARLARGPLVPGDALALALQIAQGLASAHAVEIVHRDLKPPNVLIEPGGRAVVTDFGIACALTGDVRLTVEGTGFMGTPAYMSPEQVRGDTVDATSDIYSLGVMLFEMLTGRLPFAGDTAISLAVARLQTPPDDPRNHALVGDGIAQLVLDCLSREAAARPATIAEVAARIAALQAAGDPVSTAARASFATTSVPALTPVPAVTAVPSSAAGSQAARTGTFASTRVGQQGVAVLPFRYRGAPGDEYFADALTDEVIDLLSRNRGLRVAARGATAKLGPDADPRTVGSELGVDVVVDGTVQRAGDAIRIQARLVAVDTGVQLWSERFDGRLTDVFELQDKIATQVAETLRVQIATVDQRNEVPAEAVALYMRARSLMRIYNLGGTGPEGAVGLLEQALALAPSFRPAIAAHAVATERMWFAPAARNDIRWRERAMASVARALELAPDVPETHLAAGRMAMQRADYGTAARAIARAISIAPTFATAHEVLGILQCECGRAEEGLRHLRIALSLDPTTVNAPMYEARYYEMHGDPARADAIFDEFERSRVFDVGAIAMRLRVSAWRRDKDAIRRLRDKLARSDTGGLPFDALIRSYLEEIDIDEALVHLRMAIHADLGPRFSTLMRQVATETTALVGRLDDAEAMLREAIDDALVDLDWMDHCPVLAPLRERPAYAALRARVHARAGEIWTVA
jgi:serine/threonine-protein kinase